MIAPWTTFIFVSGLSQLTLLHADEIKDFDKAVLEEHNQFRKQFQAPPLALNKELSDGASEEALRVLKEYSNTGSISPPSDLGRGGKKFGDNTFISVTLATKTPTAKMVCDGWEKEQQYYNWKNPEFVVKAGHFTQMVWKSSTDLGVGRASGRNPKKQFVNVVVVRYSPPGNIIEEDAFKENVLSKV